MADKGLRVKGKTYKSISEVPEQYRAQWEAGSRQKDPGNVDPNVGPNAGRTIVPHVTTFSGIVSTLAKTYRNHDEAIRHNVQNAHMMRRDPMIMGPLLARQRAVALLNWSVEPEDKTSEVEVRIAKELTKMISMIPRFTEYRRNLLEAVWYGRYAIQHKWSFVRKGGAKGKGVIDWVPVHGDKIMFRYDDGTGKYDPNEIGIKVSPAHVKNDIWAGKPELEYNTEGSAVFLRKWERSRLALHKHLIMDGDYEDPTTAGMIHGVGLRHFLYWAWFQKQETLAQLAEIVERTGMGFTIYYYPAGNEQARAKVEEVAEDQAHKNQIIMPYDAANPGSYGIDQVQPVTAGIPALTNLLDEYWGSWIIRFILGQTLSMRDGGGGLGTGTADLHKESFLQIIEYDAHALDETLTQDLVRMYVLFNYPSYRHINFKFKSHTEKAVPLEKLQSIQAAWSMGAKVKAADVMDLVGMTVAGEEDDALYNPQLAIALKQFRETMNQDREQQVAEELAQQQSKEKESVQRYSKLYEKRQPVPVRRPARRGPKGMTLGGSQSGKADKPYKPPKELVYKDPEKNSKDGAGPGDHSDSDWDVTWKQFLGELTGLRGEMPEEAYGSAGIAAAQKYMPRDPGDKENPDYRRAFQYAEGDELDIENVEGRESELTDPDVSELQAIESEDIEGQLAREQIDEKQATDIAKQEAAQIKGGMDDEQLASDIKVEEQEVVSEKDKPEDLVDYHPEKDRSKEGAHFDEETTPIRLAYLHGIRKAGQSVPTNLLDNLSRKEREAFVVAGNMDRVQEALARLKSEGKIEKGASLLEAKEFLTGDELDAYKDVSYKFGLNPDTGEKQEGKSVLDDEQKRMAHSLSRKNANDFLSSYEINPKALEQVSGLMEAKGPTAKDVVRTEGPQAYIDGYQRRMSSAKRQFNSLVDTFKNMEKDLAKAKTEEDKEDIRNSMQKQTEVLSGEIEKANRLAERLEAAGLMSRAESQSHKNDVARLMKPIAKGTRKFGDKTFEQRTLPEVNVGELHSTINESMKEFYDLNRERIQAQKDGDEDAYKSITAQMAAIDENIKSDHDSFKSLAGDDYTSEVKKSFNSFARKSAKYIDTPFGELQIQRKTTAGTQLPDLKGQAKEEEGAKPEISEEAQKKIDALSGARVGDLRTEAEGVFGELGIEADPKGLKKPQLRELLTAHYSGEDITQSELLKPEEKAPAEDKPPVEDEGKVVESETGAEVQNPFMTEEAQKIDLSKYPGVRHVSIDTIDPPKNSPDTKITVSEPFNYHDRMVVSVDINGVKVPFYASTGQGEKKTVATHKFYPFFGITGDRWFNKGTEDLINNYYNKPILAHVAKSLDEKHKDLLSDHAKDSVDLIRNKLPREWSYWKKGREDASDWVFPGDMLEGLNPTGKVTDRNRAQFVRNIMETGRRLDLAVVGKSSIAEDDPRLQPTETEESGVIDKATGSGLAQSIAEGEVDISKEEEEREGAPVTGQPPAGDGGAEPPVTGDGGEGAGMPEGEGDGEKKITEEELLKRLPNEPECRMSQRHWIL
jgi:phage gp29-like protein